MGRFEVPQFAEGTQALVAAMAGAHAKGAFTVVAGGDSVAALGGAKGAEKVSFVSTGGGASLQLLEGKSMPGLEALL
jgi:phosphoglycerate kinase